MARKKQVADVEETETEIETPEIEETETEIETPEIEETETETEIETPEIEETETETETVNNLIMVRAVEGDMYEPFQRIRLMQGKATPVELSGWVDSQIATGLLEKC